MNHRLDRREILSLLGLATLGRLPMAMAGGHTGGAAAAGRAPMLRLIANENPYGPGPAARQAAEKAVALGWRYAMSETRRLKQLIAELEGVDPKQVMIGAGSTEILRVAALRYARDGGEVLAARPTFSFLPNYARQLGAEVREVPLDKNMVTDLSAMAAAVSGQTRLVYLCNPNNPTGTRVTGAAMREFCAEISPRAAIVVDEAYMDLADDFVEHTVRPRILAGDRVILARTFSKLHGMAGMRIGYALAPEAVIRELEQLRITMPNLIGVMAATASLTDQEFLAFSRAQIRQAMQITTTALEEIGRPYTRSYGNFLLFDTGGSGRDFGAAMRSEGILTGTTFSPYDRWARISMGKLEDMQALALAMTRYFQAPG